MLTNAPPSTPRPVDKKTAQALARLTRNYQSFANTIAEAKKRGIPSRCLDESQHRLTVHAATVAKAEMAVERGTRADHKQLKYPLRQSADLISSQYYELMMELNSYTTPPIGAITNTAASQNIATATALPLQRNTNTYSY